MNRIIVVTTPTIPGRSITSALGLVRGNAIRVRHVGKDILAGLRNLVGGELHEYVKLIAETREQALDRMVEEAASLNADAIVSCRFSTSVIMTRAAELLAYGTAVTLAPEN